MGLFSALLGNANTLDPAKAAAEYARVLYPGEPIELAFKLFRDVFLFTGTRIILIDRQGVTGQRVDYHSLPYSSISHFCVETAGMFDLDAELKIWLKGSHLPIQKKFNKQIDVYQVQALLASKISG